MFRRLEKVDSATARGDGSLTRHSTVDSGFTESEYDEGNGDNDYLDFGQIPLERVESLTGEKEENQVKDLFPTSVFNSHAANYGVMKPQLTRGADLVQESSSLAKLGLHKAATDTRQVLPTDAPAVNQTLGALDKEHAFTCQQAPFHVMETHFYLVRCNLSSAVDEVANLFNAPLDDLSIDITFDKDTCTWSGACFDGACPELCQFEVALYESNKSCQGYMLECCRKAGPIKTFNKVWFMVSDSFKASGWVAEVGRPCEDMLALLKEAHPVPLFQPSGMPAAFEEDHLPSLHSTADSIGSFTSDVSAPFSGFSGMSGITTVEGNSPRSQMSSPRTSSRSADVELAIASVAKMAAHEKEEPRREAARVLCDMSLDEQLVEPMCTPEVVSALVNLTSRGAAANINKGEGLMELDDGASTENEEMEEEGLVAPLPVDMGDFNTAYCAFSALSNMASSTVAVEPFLLSGAVRTILEHVVDGPASSVFVRREAARSLRSLCCKRRNADKIVSYLGADRVRDFVKSVDELQDEKVRLHAEFARENLLEAVVC